MIRSLLHPSRQSVLMRLLMIVVLLAIAATIIIPNYITGDWVWENPPKLPHQTQLRALTDKGLTIPGWQTTEQAAVEISGQTWSIQALVPEEGAIHSTVEQPNATVDELPSITPENPAILLLRPQTWHRDMPQVEWMDLNGVQNWKVDQKTTLKFTISPSSDFLTGNDSASHDDDTGVGGHLRPMQVQTRFFRGWNRQRTYAVVQWYAWPTGGNPAPSRWFWVDQGAQVRDRHRMPWVAASVMVPIKPLGDRQSAQPTVEALSQEIQNALIQQVFSEPT